MHESPDGATTRLNLAIHRDPYTNVEVVWRNARRSRWLKVRAYRSDAMMTTINLLFSWHGLWHPIISAQGKSRSRTWQYSLNTRCLARTIVVETSNAHCY